MFFDKKEYQQAAQAETVDEKKLENLFKQAVERGAILALYHFDAHGKNAEAVKNTLIEFVSRLANERGVLYCKGEIETAIEREGMFSCASEVKILAENLNVLLNLALRYGPIAIEVLAPSEMRLDVQEIQNLLLDASQTSQDYANYILEKLMKPEDYAVLQQKIARRAELGKQLKEKHEKQKEKQSEKQGEKQGEKQQSEEQGENLE